MGYLAGITERARIIPAAMCLGWRHPLIVSREASTLYALSRGRFVLSVCPGNVHHDFDITGEDWDARGKRTEDSLQVFRMLIDAESPMSFKGKTCAFDDAVIKPRPSGMHLWYGGTSKVALRRVAQYCDGWIPAGGPGYFREVLPQVQELAQGFGRGGAAVEAGMITRVTIADTDEQARAVSQRTLDYQHEAEWLKRHDLKDIEAAWLVGTPEKVAGQIDAIADAGVGLILNTFIAHTVADVVEQMERLAREVVPLTRSGVLA
jgi:alkanesulfonate monooxygenase SsuD/methylene tetrahydromethanopterin reductase-like flavin-dependent oxidoreductase (luciferase family)